MTDAPSHGDDLSAALRSLVSDRAADLYVALLDGRPADDPDASAVEELARAGLVGIEHGSGAPFAHPPRFALARALHNATRAWLAAAPDVDRLTTVLDRLGPEPPPSRDGAPAVVDDPAERQRAVEALVISATKELAVLQPYYEWIPDEEFESGGWTSTPDANTPERVVCRFVYDERLFRVPGFERVIHEEVALGAQVRITGNPLPGFLLVVDARAAAYTPEPQGVGRISTEESLVAMLHMTFEAAWAGSTPLQRSTELGDDLLTVLTLIGLGHNNRQISSMLDLHERTIRRRVNELLDHFGEIERAALVRHAHLTHPEP